MDDLSALKTKLDALDNELAAQIVEVERAIGDLRLGVPIELRIDEESTLVLGER